MQNTHNCYFFIADYHSLTTHPTPENLGNNVSQVLAEYLACGIDPNKATLYVQSDVVEVAELYLLFNMISYVGELERTASFKEKIRQQPQNVNAGLLTYPVLMAADILLHRAHKVPVGKDQEQHLEMARNIAKRFNFMYKTEYFPEPQAFNFGENLVKIPGLDGSGKMGKSEGNGIYLIDDPESIRKKVMRAVTDTGPTEPNQPVSESVQNLFTIMKVVSQPSTLEHFQFAYANCSIRYGDLKKQLAEDIITTLTPVRERIIDIRKDTEGLAKIAAIGAEKARENARKTIREVRSAIGLKVL